ncbi:MAG: heavy-metal-associated domain-containing protein [Anaerotignum sp.]|nr:heavy-metal-associated domain-containing protein [Anaerotignum sp.]
MDAIIVLLVVAVIGVYSVKKYRDNMKYGCCSSGGYKEKKRPVADENADNYPYSAALTIKGMTCKNCSTRVENYLNREEGIWAQVDLKKNTALVRMKTERTAEELADIVKRAGYTVIDTK